MRAPDPSDDRGHRQQLPDRHPGGAAGRHAHHQGQHDEAQDVIDDGRPQDGLADAGPGDAQLAQRRRTDPDAGGREDSTHEQGRRHAVAEPTGDRGSEHERESHPTDRGEDRRPTDLADGHDIGLEAGDGQDAEGADLGQHLEVAVQRDEAQDGGPDDEARCDLAGHPREAQMLREEAAQLRRDEHSSQR